MVGMERSKVHIAVDAMGGDHAPAEIVKGAVWAATELSGVDRILLVGDRERVEAELRGSLGNLKSAVILDSRLGIRAELERDKQRGRLDALTPREKEVMLQVARGLTSREIAELFGISPRTVETHRERVMAKRRMKSVADLTRFVVEMDLEYVVVTSVTRDDLPDGGAGTFAATIRAIRRRKPEARIEVLIPDFQGSKDALETVLAARPDVLNHNLETVPRLYATVRPEADYQRSLDLLRESPAA